MNTHHRRSSTGYPKRRLIGAVMIIIPVLLCGGWMWQSIWGFGGVYTHVRYIPTPDSLIEDTASTAFSFDARNKALRLYSVEMTQAELVRFHEQALPRAGWTITTATYVTTARGEQVSCLIARQRNQTAYISIRQSAESPITSGVLISLNTPEPSYCGFEIMQ